MRTKRVMRASRGASGSGMVTDLCDQGDHLHKPDVQVSGTLRTPLRLVQTSISDMTGASGAKLGNAFVTTVYQSMKSSKVHEKNLAVASASA